METRRKSLENILERYMLVPCQGTKNENRLQRGLISNVAALSEIKIQLNRMWLNSKMSYLF